MAHGSDRLHMIELATQHTPKIKPCPYELEMAPSSYTYDVVWSMRHKVRFMPIEFSIIVGMDNANKIKEWHRWQELIEMIPFLVVKRRGIEQQTD